MTVNATRRDIQRTRQLQTAAALRGALMVLVRMIPEACEDAGLQCCTDAEHDRAIAKAAAALYGADRAAWPAFIRKAAEGGYSS